MILNCSGQVDNSFVSLSSHSTGQLRFIVYAPALGLPICFESFKGQLVRIPSKKISLFLNTVYRPPIFFSKRQFCSDF